MVFGKSRFHSLVKKTFSNNIFSIDFPVTVGFLSFFKKCTRWTGLMDGAVHMWTTDGCGQWAHTVRTWYGHRYTRRRPRFGPRRRPNRHYCFHRRRVAPIRLCRRVRARVESVHFAEVPGVTSVSLSIREHLLNTSFVGTLSILVLISRS